MAEDETEIGETPKKKGLLLPLLIGLVLAAAAGGRGILGGDQRASSRPEDAGDSAAWPGRRAMPRRNAPAPTSMMSPSWRLSRWW